ncbi:hypothetical protein PIROE2DRAFT_70116 [Piromyces sp. E2]|nr:hypothetical protein PIROE2DRAFT_70116 [Piromyces sp. E2]|eukprot:OUM56989.1 hypothetical protein PIROE2DRAFT_70116 [Piromyces sp. E2]
MLGNSRYSCNLRSSRSTVIDYKKSIKKRIEKKEQQIKQMIDKNEKKLEYDVLENKILRRFGKNKDCLRLFEVNFEIMAEKLIDDEDNIKRFVEKLNQVIVNVKKFEGIERTLRQPLFLNVIEVFRSSDALIEACKVGNKKACRWLISMKVNPKIQDRYGKTALMYAVKQWNMSDIVAELVKLPDHDFVDYVDIDGNTALFYSIENSEIFDMVLEATTIYDTVNKDNDTILTYVCKHDKIKCINSILHVVDNTTLDVNAYNNEGKNAALYLLENFRSHELIKFHRYCKSFDVNFYTENGESLVNFFIERFYQNFKDDTFMKEGAQYISKIGKKYGRTMNALIEIGCNFNVSIDGDGNTPMNFFLMIHDYVSALNLVERCHTINLSICNKYGVNANYLVSHITRQDFERIDNIRDYLMMNIYYDRFKCKFYSHNTFQYLKRNDIVVISPYQIPMHLDVLERIIATGYFSLSAEISDSESIRGSSDCNSFQDDDDDDDDDDQISIQESVDQYSIQGSSDQECNSEKCKKLRKYNVNENTITSKKLFSSILLRKFRN